MFDALAQRIGGTHVAVGDKHPGRRGLHLLQPGQQLLGIGMGRGRLQLLHLGADAHFLAQHAQRFLSSRQACAARAWGLVAGEQNQVPVVACVQRQVVQHAPAGGHATGRQNHPRAMQARQCFGFFGGFHQGGATRHLCQLGVAEAVRAQVFAQQPGGADGPGAVEEHWQRGRNAPGFFQPRDGQLQLLRPAHGKHRHHGHATARGEL